MAVEQAQGAPARFLEVYRIDPTCRFTLVLGFRLRGELAKLANLAQLSPQMHQHLCRRFSALCRQIGASDAEATALLDGITVSELLEEQIVTSIRRKLAGRPVGSTEAVDLYVAKLVARCLEWADRRASVTRGDVDADRSIRWRSAVERECVPGIRQGPR